MANAISTKSATISNSALGISAFSFAAGHLTVAQRARISAQLAGAMITWDGTDPTAQLGHLQPADGLMQVVDGNASINALKFLREAGTDSEVTITLEIF